MTPAQLMLLADEHNAAHDPKGEARARTPARHYDSPLDMVALSAMQRSG